jgi:integrase
VSSVKRRPDGKYRARWYDLGGKEHSRHFDRKRDADAFLSTVEADKLRGQYVDVNDKTTVAEYARRWAAGRPHNPRTARRTASLIKVHIEGTSLGGRRLSRVLPSDAQAWVSDRALVLAPLSLEKLVGLVRSIFAAAVLDRLVGSSPFTRISRPESHRERVVPLTVEQVRQILAQMPDRNKAMVIVQAGLGLRIGELMGLRACDVDFLRRVVRVETQIPPNETERDDPKTLLSKRPLPLPTFVAEALARHMADYPPAPDGSVFYTRRLHPYTHSHYEGIFRKAVAAAGSSTSERSEVEAMPEGTTPHDLRHHYASVLLAAGESVVAVAERLGHKNASLVLSTYGHLMPGSEERTRKALDGAWNADQVRTSGSGKVV